jgi:spore coat protein A
MDCTRRRLLKAGALGGAGLLVPWKRLVSSASATGTLTPFVDPLPSLLPISPVSTAGGVAAYEVAMTPFKQKLHKNLPATPLWGYGDARNPTGVFPGPFFEARRGSPITVRWMNSLPAAHFLPIDPTIHGAGEEGPTPQVRTVVHLHGHKVLPDSDGHPDAWFTNGFAQTGNPPFPIIQNYHYPNDQAATQLWYHDHAIGIVRLNLYAGLLGTYLLRDDEEDALNLPRAPYEVPLIIVDRMFNPNGSLLYPTFDASDPAVPPIWIPEFFGDNVLVNGKVFPFLEVEPRRYRFRILNASNARFYHMTLVRSDRAGNPLFGSVPAFQQIGADQGFLPKPVELAELLIGPAERMDVVIDFAGFDGTNFVITNDAKAPFPDGDDVIPAQVMQFRVNKPLQGSDTSSIPKSLVPVPLMDTATATVTRDITINEDDSTLDNPIIGTLGAPGPDRAAPYGRHWYEAVTETPRAGAIEVWRLINTTGDAHAIHIHLVRFQVIDRRPFDPDRYIATGQLVFTGPTRKADPNERPAFKDTVRSMPGTVTRLIAKFELPNGVTIPPGQRFQYVFHCHILEHEDNEMMRPYDVLP